MGKQTNRGQTLFASLLYTQPDSATVAITVCSLGCDNTVPIVKQSTLKRTGLGNNDTVKCTHSLTVWQLTCQQGICFWSVSADVCVPH